MSFETTWLSDTGYFLLLAFEPLVVVRFMIHDRNCREILSERRRLRLPLQPGCLPRILAGDLTVFERPGEIEQRQQIAHAEDGCTGGGEDVKHLELRRIRRIAPRHAESSQDELREEGEVESNEGDHGSELRNLLRIHAARPLGPPEVNTGEEGHQHAAHHHEVEVRHDEVGLGEVDIRTGCSQEDAGESADWEQAHEAEG